MKTKVANTRRSGTNRVRARGAKSIFVAMVLSCAMVPFASFAGTFSDIPLPLSKSDAMMSGVPIDLAVGAKVFSGCTGCHDTGPSAANSVGPMLNGIVGRKAGGAEGFAYSRALMAAGKNGLVWTPYKLDAFLMAPNAFLVGNKMPFGGIKDEAARRNLIGYLQTLQ